MLAIQRISKVTWFGLQGEVLLKLLRRILWLLVRCVHGLYSGAKLSASEHKRYCNMVGSLLYLECWFCPDISLAVSELSRFVSCPGEKHIVAVKHLLRYLKGSRELGLKYSKPGNSGPMDRPNQLWGPWIRTGLAVLTAGSLPLATP